LTRQREPKTPKKTSSFDRISSPGIGVVFGAVFNKKATSIAVLGTADVLGRWRGNWRNG
jgi:hypothetical protein